MYLVMLVWRDLDPHDLDVDVLVRTKNEACRSRLLEVEAQAGHVHSLFL